MEKVSSISNYVISGNHGTYFTPHVKLEVSSKSGSITGESYLEDAFEFYDKIIEWFDKYFEENDSFTLDLKLVYFNTSSSRAILDVLRQLKTKQEQGKIITVNWYYPDPDDGEMLLEAEDFTEESGLALNLVEYKISE